LLFSSLEIERENIMDTPDVIKPEPVVKPQGNPSGEPPENQSGGETTPEDKARAELLAKINEEKELLDAQADLEKSKTTLLTAQLGTFNNQSTAQAVDTGTATTPYIVEFLSQKILIENAEEIAKKINALGENISKILIVDSMELCTDDVGLMQIKSQINGYNELFKERLLEDVTLLHESIRVTPSNEEPRIASELPSERAYSLPLAGVSAALTGLSSILTGISSIAGFFQDKYSIKAAKYTPDLVPLQARVAGKVTKCPVIFNKNYRTDSSPLLEMLKEALILRETLSEKKGKLESVSAQNPDPQKEAVEKPKRELAVNSSDTLIKAFDGFFTLLTTIPSGASYSPLMIAIMRDSIDQLGITHYLYLSISSVGGDVITVSSIWPWKSGQMSVMVGSIFTAILIDKTGKVVFADTIAPNLKKIKFQFNKFSKDM
jgi:hypothetical protein